MQGSPLKRPQPMRGRPPRPQRRAGKPGALNLALSGDFDDQVLISVDGVEVVRSSGKTIAIDRVAPGLRKISVHAKKGQKDLETARMVDVKPGLQELELALG